MLAIAVVLMFGAAVVSATLSQIFRVAVYQYALSGQTPGGFAGPQLQAAFQPQPGLAVAPVARKIVRVERNRLNLDGVEQRDKHFYRAPLGPL